MKKLLALLLAAVMVFALASCFTEPDPAPTPDPTPDEEGTELEVMTYEEYVNAAIEDEVLVEAYVQATQSWWDNKITVYAADQDGAYFIYELACSEEDAAKLVPGTKILVHGYKAEWAGEVEIIDATFEFVEGDSYIADAVDLTEDLGTEGLIDYQNQLAYFAGLTVEEVEFKGGEPGDDIYLTVAYNGKSYSFCVERYLTGPETEVYQAVSALEAGDVIDVTGFLYWYEGVNTHVTEINKVGPLSYAEFVAKELDDEVIVEAYVQATQSWWSDKITVYAADQDGAYFIYELACSAEDAAKLVPGAKIVVRGYKAEWGGEIEIVDATFAFVEADPYIAPAKDVTEYLGTDELVNYQNQYVSFTGLTIEDIEYKGGEPGDDIYVTVGYNGATYSFCVERYLTDPETDLYKAVQALQIGEVVNITGFLYWYNGVNTHITGVSK